MAETAAIASILKALSYGIPAAILVSAVLIFMILSKYQKEKTDRDRVEHMNKWNSMVDTQKEAIELLVDSHKKMVDQLLKNHQEQLDRMFRTGERHAQTLEAMGHNLAILSRAIEQKAICPINQKG